MLRTLLLLFKFRISSLCRKDGGNWHFLNTWCIIVLFTYCIAQNNRMLLDLGFCLALDSPNSSHETSSWQYLSLSIATSLRALVILLLLDLISSCEVQLKAMADHSAAILQLFPLKNPGAYPQVRKLRRIV